MSESILVGRNTKPAVKYILCTEVITQSTAWKVPTGIKRGQLSVRLFGGGGGTCEFGAGDGGGNMNYADLNGIGEGSIIQITIGGGGGTNSSGGITSFGSYLSASGGGGGTQTYPGNGGTGGGAGSVCDGGFGIYGGGGGGHGGSYSHDKDESSSSEASNGGNGGIYGGGGGSGTEQSTSTWLYRDNKRAGFGGMYGGNGGYYYNNPDYNNNPIWYVLPNYSINGVNTAGMNLDFEGTGMRGNFGNKAITNIDFAGVNGILGGGGGGGGYGGNGGNGGDGWINSPQFRYTALAGGGGGGGGYGGNGGHGSSMYGGGGGGYGGRGADGKTYFDTYLSNTSGGGGGGYGTQNYGAGGGGTAINDLYGMSGCCVIRYYQVQNA